MIQIVCWRTEQGFYYFMLKMMFFSVILTAFNIHSGPINEKPIVAVIPSYNNEQLIEKNLTSVLTQKYTNFRVIYIDDCSTDKTMPLAQEIINRFSANAVLIHNENRKGALRNIYEVIHQHCKDEEIVALIDGDDWLAHENVFALLNEEYSKESSPWLTHGSYITSRGVPGISAPVNKKVIQRNRFREYTQPSHLRTFYAWLFKAIKKKDLMFEGDFFPMAWDLAILYPMMEMAGENQVFIPDILYIYNDESPINDHRKNHALQLSLFKSIKEMNKYVPIKEKTFQEAIQKFSSPIGSLSGTSGLQGVDQIYVINLDERPQKWEQIKLLFEAQELSPTRVPAINGWKINKNVINQINYKGNLHGSLNPGRVGCALSHLKVWMDAIARNFQIVWVVEDDVEFLTSPHVLSQLLADLAKIDSNWDVLYTDSNTRDWNGAYADSVLLVPPPPFIEASEEVQNQAITIISQDFAKIGCRHGCYSMLISKNGLKKLYEFHKSYPLWAPIDHSLHYTPNLRQYIVRHNVVTHSNEKRVSDTDDPIE